MLTHADVWLTYAGWEAKEAGGEGVKVEELARNVEVAAYVRMLTDAS